MVEEALVTIQKKPIEGVIPRIRDFIHAERHSELDRKHVDFLITLENGHKVPLQVKSSERHARRFEKKNRTYKEFIPVVVVKIGEALDSIIQKIIGCIQYALKKLQRSIEKNTYLDRMRRNPINRPKKHRSFNRFHSPSMCH